MCIRDSPNSQRTQAIRDEIAQRHQVTCVAANCLEMEEEDVSALLKQVLYEFPLKEMDLFLPPWVDALPQEHPIKAEMCIRDSDRPVQIAAGKAEGDLFSYRAQGGTQAGVPAGRHHQIPVGAGGRQLH